MTQSARYVAHSDAGHCHLLEAKSFEDAAIGFAEASAASADDEIRVIVQSVDGGPEHCFVVHLSAAAGAA